MDAETAERMEITQDEESRMGRTMTKWICRNEVCTGGNIGGVGCTVEVPPNFAPPDTCIYISGDETDVKWRQVEPLVGCLGKDAPQVSCRLLDEQVDDLKHLLKDELRKIRYALDNHSHEYEIHGVTRRREGV